MHGRPFLLNRSFQCVVDPCPMAGVQGTEMTSAALNRPPRGLSWRGRPTPDGLTPASKPTIAKNASHRAQPCCSRRTRGRARPRRRSVRDGAESSIWSQTGAPAALALDRDRPSKQRDRWWRSERPGAERDRVRGFARVFVGEREVEVVAQRCSGPGRGHGGMVESKVLSGLMTTCGRSSGCRLRSCASLMGPPERQWRGTTSLGCQRRRWDDRLGGGVGSSAPVSVTVGLWRCR
jgi:hypothetical protein